MDDMKKLRETLEMIQREYPIVMHIELSRVYTMVRRMQAEKKYNIPIPLRCGVAISVENGKHANEMAEEEWEKFYLTLQKELKRREESLYYKLFPKE